MASSYTFILATILLVSLPSTFSQLSPSYAPAFAPDAAPGPFADMAPPPGPDCFTALANASDCLTFVDRDSNLTRPDPGCCSELANLVDTQPICLCQLLGNSSGLGLSIDTNKALALPGVCNVTTPPVSTCALIGVPIASPSPSGAFAPSPNGAFAPSAGGDGSVGASPTPGNSDNASPATLGCNPHLFIGLTVALFAYFF